MRIETLIFMALLSVACGLAKPNLSDKVDRARKGDTRVQLGAKAELELEHAGLRTCLRLTGVIDGPLSGGLPKAVEVYCSCKVDDMTEYGLGGANNGGGTDGREFTFPAGSMKKGEFRYVSKEREKFKEYFGFEPDYTHGNAVNINGDDAIELFKGDSVIDVFGEINEDGTGKPWEYLDGWAYRKDGTGRDGTTFKIDSWMMSGKDALDGTNSNDEADKPFPIGKFSRFEPLPCGIDCISCNAAQQCDTCGNSTFLSSSGECLPDCPPGEYSEPYKPGEENSGKACKKCEAGSIRRRRATSCTACDYGKIAQTGQDDCVNVQSMCGPDQCEGCLDCMKLARPSIKACHDRRGSDLDCIDFDRLWCGEFMRKLVGCESFSLSCYFKLLCHNPCVCSDWKTVRCGGEQSGTPDKCTDAERASLLQGFNLTASSSANFMQGDGPETAFDTALQDGIFQHLSSSTSSSKELASLIKRGQHSTLQHRRMAPSDATSSLDTSVNGKCR